MSNVIGSDPGPIYQVEFYRTGSGHAPIEEFIRKMDPKMREKALRTIGLLRRFGPLLGEPHSKKLAKGLFELRIQQSNSITRILYFFIRDRKVILTNGFIKKQSKTPRAEIERAAACKADFESRHPDG